MYLVAKDNLPFSLVDSDAFSFFIKTLNPHYKAPSRKTLTNMIDKKYDYLKSKVMDLLASTKYITLTTDVWTSSKTEAHLGLTAHFLKDDRLESIALGNY